MKKFTMTSTMILEMDEDFNMLESGVEESIASGEVKVTIAKVIVVDEKGNNVMTRINVSSDEMQEMVKESRV
jgi:hypothetical protein